MKILIASDSYIFQTSGVSNVVISLARDLRRIGHDVKVLALANGKTSFIDGGDYFIRSFSAFFYPDLRVSVARHDPLLDELIQWNPDLIHLHTEASVARMAYDIAAKTHSPIVITTHTDYAQYAFGRFRGTPPVRLLMSACGRVLYRGAVAVTVPSGKARTFALLRPALDRTTVIPNGIPLERYGRRIDEKERSDLFRRCGLEDNGCTLVMITRVSREKNIKEILRFMPALIRALPQAQLVIVGDGPDRKRLQAYCEHSGLNDRVRFMGRIPPEEVYRYYGMGDVFVSASTFEVHSLSYLEAMACGLPLVCRDDMSLKGVLEDGENGFVYRSQQEFVSAVARIVGDKALWQAMHEKALVNARQFSDQRYMERTLALYEEILSRRVG